MNDAFWEIERKLRFPVVAISPAGWVNAAEEPVDVTD
jgi:hypothetical protein